MLLDVFFRSEMARILSVMFPISQVSHYSSQIKELDIKDLETPDGIPEVDLIAFMASNAEYLIRGWFTVKAAGEIRKALRFG